MSLQPLVVYVDVDDTFVRSFGSKRIAMTSMIEHVRSLQARDALLYCWSSGGADYAQASAREFGIEECFVAFLPKPNVMIDDMEIGAWPRLVRLHPNEAVSHNAEDYQNLLAGK